MSDMIDLILDLVVLGLLTIAGLVMVLLAVLMALQSMYRLLRWKQGEGVLARHKREDGCFLPVVEHQIGGEVYRFTSDFGRGKRFGKRGTAITILYDPKRPDQGTIRSFKSLWLFPILLAVMSALVMVFPGAEFWTRFSVWLAQ